MKFSQHLYHKGLAGNYLVLHKLSDIRSFFYSLGISRQGLKRSYMCPPISKHVSVFYKVKFSKNDLPWFGLKFKGTRAEKEHTQILKEHKIFRS